MNNVNMKKELSDEARSKIDFGKEITDEQVEEIIDDLIISDKYKLLSLEEKIRLKKEVFDSIRRLDILQVFVEDKDITEIMINGINNIFVEKNGQLMEIPEHFDSEEKLNDVIQQIVAGCNRAVNEASPIVDARLPDGSRVNVVMKPVALEGPIVTIRRFPEKPITMRQLIMNGSITKEAAVFLRNLVIAGYNIIISGGTGSGKTTFLNVLSGFIPENERVITIEDSAELQLQGLRNLVRLETRNNKSADCEDIDIRALIRCSLRMRPDRIIVGEVRGSEAIDMMQCLNTGHSGSMSTGHANSAEDMLYRLENMILMGMDIPLIAIRQQIVSGIDLVVHLGRLRDKSRRVLQISEVMDINEGKIVTNSLFEFVEKGEKNGKIYGSLERKNQLFNTKKLKEAGIVG